MFCMPKALNKKVEERVKHRRDIGGLFIPAGLFLGMGLGFVFNQLVAGIFLGLGLGFLLFAIVSLIKKK